MAAEVEKEDTVGEDGVEVKANSNDDPSPESDVDEEDGWDYDTLDDDSGA